MARKRNRETKSDWYDPFNPLLNTTRRTQAYYDHYYLHLLNIAMQMFEWKGLPDTIDPGFIEKTLISTGTVAFYKDKELGYLACKGTLSGTIDIYGLPNRFHAHSPHYNHTFDLFNYKDMKTGDLGVLIKNDELRTSMIPTLSMFASDLAETKDIIRVNLNAQKTPKIFMSNDKNVLSMRNLAQQIDGNVMNIFVDEKLDLTQIKDFDATAPYVADKVNQHRDAIWNECMTFLGLKNANLQKKERMITSEVDSIDEQIDSSGNVFLRTRKEACRMINLLHPDLNVSVDYRVKPLEEQDDSEKEDLEDDINHTIKEDN